MLNKLKKHKDLVYIVDGTVNYYKNEKIDHKLESQTAVSSFDDLSELCLYRLNKHYNTINVKPHGKLLDKYTPEGIKDRYDHSKNNYGEPVIILEERLKVDSVEDYTTEIIITITEKLL